MSDIDINNRLGLCTAEGSIDDLKYKTFEYFKGNINNEYYIHWIIECTFCGCIVDIVNFSNGDLNSHTKCEHM